MNQHIVTNIPPLDRPFELLWRHYNLVRFFGPLQPLEGILNDYRHMLVYLVTKTSRDYLRSRDVVLSAHGLVAGKETNPLTLMEFPFVFEDFINGAQRACGMVTLLMNAGALPETWKPEFHSVDSAKEKIWAIRDMVQHVLARVLQKREPDQPMLLSPSADGSHVQLANEQLAFADVVALLQWLFDVTAALVPTFDVANAGADIAPGPFKLTATVTTTVSSGDGRVTVTS